MQLGRDGKLFGELSLDLVGTGRGSFRAQRLYAHQSSKHDFKNRLLESTLVWVSGTRRCRGPKAKGSGLLWSTHHMVSPTYIHQLLKVSLLCIPEQKNSRGGGDFCDHPCIYRSRERERERERESRGE